MEISSNISILRRCTPHQYVHQLYFGCADNVQSSSRIRTSSSDSRQQKHRQLVVSPTRRKESVSEERNKEFWISQQTKLRVSNFTKTKVSGALVNQLMRRTKIQPQQQHCNVINKNSSTLQGFLKQQNLLRPPDNDNDMPPRSVFSKYSSSRAHQQLSPMRLKPFPAEVFRPTKSKYIVSNFSQNELTAWGIDEKDYLAI